MKEIIEAKSLSATPLLPLKKGRQNKIVLVGGCFDIVHLGHIKFLEEAKKAGDILIVMLESDENIRKIKGQNRPINNQENRAEFLTKLKMVDLVIKLPEMKSDEDYWKIIEKIKPTIIAISEGDKNIEKKKMQAEKIGAKLIKVTDLVKKHSTSKIIEVISESF
jgi:rfaE bifunctional protein nucleotidyltransferase chain/domain